MKEILYFLGDLIERNVTDSEGQIMLCKIALNLLSEVVIDAGDLSYREDRELAISFYSMLANKAALNEEFRYAHGYYEHAIRIKYALKQFDSTYVYLLKRASEVAKKMEFTDLIKEYIEIALKQFPEGSEEHIELSQLLTTFSEGEDFV